MQNIPVSLAAAYLCNLGPAKDCGDMAVCVYAAGTVEERYYFETIFICLTLTVILLSWLLDPESIKFKNSYTMTIIWLWKYPDWKEFDR